MLQQIGDYAGNFGRGMQNDLKIGREDIRKVGFKERELQGKQEEAPKWDEMMMAWPLGNRIKQVAGQASPERLQAEKAYGVELKSDEGPGYQAGQLAGSVIGDIRDDGLRGIYWLMNALQATGQVINEKALFKANDMAKGVKKLYGKHDVENKISGSGVLTPKNKAAIVEQGVGKYVDGQLELNKGYSIRGRGDEAVIQHRNFEPGDLAWLSVPTGVAINSGLGLLTPFGGAEGYKAADPSDEDPSKTANVLNEIALKYIVGRTGNLLPYEEFKKVRPDVTKDEYNRYQAFKYAKDVDLDPRDGDITLPGGVIKATNEGIHGPEIQFLGRSLPVTTGVIPYATALAGGAYGVTRGKPLARGIQGGFAGLAAGQVLGNLIEGERRRRNKEDNERDTMGQYGREL